MKLYSALILFLSTCAVAQDYDLPIDPETYDMIPLTRNTSDSIINVFLESNDLKAIEFNPNDSSRFSFRVKTKRNKWELYDKRYNEMLRAEKMSITFPSQLLEDFSITIAVKGKKKYFYSLGERFLLEFDHFNELKPIKVENISSKDGQTTGDVSYIFAFRKGNKWGAMLFGDNYETYAQLIAPVGYDSFQELPIDQLTHLAETRKYDAENYIVNPLNYIDILYYWDDYERIEYNLNPDPNYLFRLQDKKGDWYLMDLEGEKYGKKGYSLEFPKSACNDKTIAHRKDKEFIYILGVDGDYLVENSGYDQIEKVLKWNYEIKTNEYGEDIMDEQGQPVYDSIPICNGLRIRKNEKWALAYASFETQKMYQLSGFHFNSPESVPDSLLKMYIYSDDGQYPLYEPEAMEAPHDFLQENSDVDIVTAIGPYKSTNKKILKIRNSNTKRWSFVIPGGFHQETDLPIAASRIIDHFYDDNKIVFEVWCDDKVGYYFYDGENIKKIKDCEFDDFKYLFLLDGTYGCALNKNGKWELYKVDTSERLMNGTATSIEELEELWSDR